MFRKSELWLTALIFGCGLAAGAQTPPSHPDASPRSTKPAHDPVKAAPSLKAVLVDPEKKALKQAATVKVTVGGLQMIDPALADEKPRKGQGHLHYQVDDGPVIATPTTKLSFHGLKAGQHTILVVLAGNDHQPLGPQEKLTVTIP
jgi:hypothetical protein